MLIRSRRGWELPERAATPEHLAIGRRRALLGAGGLALGATIGLPRSAIALDLPAATRNPRFADAARPITEERFSTNYNNYYEFGTNKNVTQPAQRLPVSPWTVKVDGMVDRPAEFNVDDLVKRMPIEERVVRHRCVEAWSMVVPWTGFPLAALLREVGAKAGAKFIRFETAALPGVMPGLRQSFYPYPYVEGCTIEEAANELSFMVVGAYGKPLPPQMGAPLRVHFPWKFGFKSGKSLTRITLTDQRPKSFWEQLQPAEYGFWANVNPAVPHPRWSQASERVLGTDERVPTLLFNGYGEFVAGLYTGLQGERLYV